MKNVLALGFLILSSAHAGPWDENNNPHHFNKIIDAQVITNFNLLPLDGKLDDERLGWSETYWPSNKGGIAFRWNHPHPTPFRFNFLSKEEIQQMSLEELAQLSPAELYDIAQSDYRYSLTRMTLNTFSETNLWWEGLCHGWAQAASNYPEPDKVIIRNPDGIRVPFGASDVKGLLAMHDSYNSQGLYTHIGGRCNAPGKVPGEGSTRDSNREMPADELALTPECQDVNAGAFHVVMSNMIGIRGKGLVADVDRFNDVWNQPVVSYSSHMVEELPVSDEESLNGIARKLSMQMKMVYGEELQFESADAVARGDDNFVSKNPVTRTAHQEFRSKVYEYILELDELDHIIGGEWISLTRPDFLWIKKRDRKFLNSPYPLAGLSKIYKPVRY